MEDQKILPTPSEAYEYVMTTTVYGQVKLWHVVIFMTLGPMLTWPMLIILLFIFFNEAKNAVRGSGLRNMAGGSGDDNVVEQLPANST